MAALTENVRVRVDPKSHQRFRAKCTKLNRDYSDMLRELIEAFADGRIKITPTEAAKDIYDVN